MYQLYGMEKWRHLMHWDYLNLLYESTAKPPPNLPREIWDLCCLFPCGSALTHWRLWPLWQMCPAFSHIPLIFLSLDFLCCSSAACLSLSFGPHIREALENKPSVSSVCFPHLYLCCAWQLWSNYLLNKLTKPNKIPCGFNISGYVCSFNKP